MKIKSIFSILTLIVGLSSCEGYDDYINDFDYSIVYFGTQKPLRTIVAYEEMQFQVGIAMGGKRENNQDEIVEFTIDPSLLDDEVLNGAGNYTLLPASYYSLENSSTMLIPKGEFIGDVTVTLNRAEFTSDPQATEKTYALPLRITDTSLDSISSGSYDEQGNQILAPKDFTILVVKYISPYHGTYYHTGTQLETNDMGETTETVYDDPDVIKNGTWDLNTLDRNTVESSGIGNFPNESLVLTFNESTNSITLSTESLNVQELSGNGVYHPEDRSIDLQYSFSREGMDYDVTETLHLRQEPEKDLRFEEW